ncbi:MAG: TolC family protein [Planctomycetales bacterium]|nr:TolC family protein [Planctomycetales bacterium]
MAPSRIYRRKSLRLLLAVAVLLPGCRSPKTAFKAHAARAPEDYYATAAADIDYPAINDCSVQACSAGLDSLPPRTLASTESASYRDITLDQVIQQGLANSKVLRDLGAAVLRSPDSTITSYDPAVVETDASTGVEAALSAFDAQLTSSLYFENNDRAINNEFFGGGATIYTQDAAVHQVQLSKRAATGSQFAARQVIEYDSTRDGRFGMEGDRLPGNLFHSAYTVKVEGEVRHPLMQGGGVEYNRIAGPTNTPGLYNGVLIARLRADVQLTEFEIAVRNLVSNLENAYWDLYFAYRDLDAKITARDASLDTWRRVKALYDAQRRGGEAEKEAQAREQYFRFQEEAENALSGKLVDGTRTGNGSTGGSFRGAGGVYVTERRLRRLMNLPASDGQLLRPEQEPVVAEIVFDWQQVMTEATHRRAELRRQKWRIRRRELELIASKNHLLPRLDAVGRYRWRGFGDDLISNDDTPTMDPRFNDAYGNLVGGDFQEWQLGLELDMPLGFRRAHSAVRNSELLLARERAILCDQQQEVIHESASAVAEVDRALKVSQTSLNRLIASREQVEAVRAAFDADKAPLNLLLEAQRRQAEAESRYHYAVTEYALAIKNAHFAKGTLLEFDGVFLTEGGWPRKAYADAADLEERRWAPRPLNYASRLSPAVSQGVYDQHRGPEAPPAMFGKLAVVEDQPERAQPEQAQSPHAQAAGEEHSEPLKLEVPPPAPEPSHGQDAPAEPAALQPAPDAKREKRSEDYKLDGLFIPTSVEQPVPLRLPRVITQPLTHPACLLPEELLRPLGPDGR